MQLCNSLLTFSDYGIRVSSEILGMSCLDCINRASENSFFSLISATGGNNMKRTCKLWRASTQTLIVS